MEGKAVGTGTVSDVEAVGVEGVEAVAGGETVRRERGAWWRGHRHLLAEYRPRPLHLQSLWQFTAQAGSAHVSLPAPVRMILLQNLQLDWGVALGGAIGVGQGTLLPGGSGPGVPFALDFEAALCSRWQRRGQAGALHAK